ncbi:unnamed protein product [Sphenostylis stenocarpa]|uniref:Uncharacterized protein n=1 Tax=Sphenostylis stenocarpa TaxID=92480 RepID=A0AA86T3W3_9FABA|nr:unnamed protein product [Sphenostylis stenocarpa]
MSMPRTMVSQLVKHERIETTVSKAKEIRRLAENMVQLGKEVGTDPNVLQDALLVLCEEMMSQAVYRTGL